PSIGRRRARHRAFLRGAADGERRGRAHARAPRAVIAVELPRTGPRAWAAAGVAISLAAGGLLFWLARTPVPLLRSQVSGLQFWSLEACVFLGLAVAAAVAQEMTGAIDRRDVAWSLALGAIAAVLTLTLPPRTNRIFYDEQIYQNVARNLADARRAQLCNDGAIEAGRPRRAAAQEKKQPHPHPPPLRPADPAVGRRGAGPSAGHATAGGAGEAVCDLAVGEPAFG